MDFKGIIERGKNYTVVVLVTGPTGVSISKAGGPFRASANALVAMSVPGYYSLRLNTTDIDTLGLLVVRVTTGGADVSVCVEVRDLVSELTTSLGGRIQQYIGNQLNTMARDLATAGGTLNTLVTQVQDVLRTVRSAFDATGKARK